MIYGSIHELQLSTFKQEFVKRVESYLNLNT